MMRHALGLLLCVVLLPGCVSWWSDDDAAVPQPPIPADPSELKELHLAWEREVDDAVAGLTAAREHIDGPRPALGLYDAQLAGLKALAGSPSVDAVLAKSDVAKGKEGAEAALAKLAREKSALDAKTTALEQAAASADNARRAAENAARIEAHNRRLAETASDLSRVAAGAIALGFLGFLFGHLVGIPRWASAGTVALGLAVATSAPQLLDFFGSDAARNIMLGTFGLLALGGLVALGLWGWRKLNPPALG